VHGLEAEIWVAVETWVWYFKLMNETVDPKLLNNPLFQRVLADALAIQDRFAAEPVYAKTGKGYLKSEGVAELQRIKEELKKKQGD
jgi:hypothetical protein